MSGGISLDGLSDDQRRIVTSLDGPLFVEAGAGSGKTFTLTRRIAWALSPGSGIQGAPFLQSLDQVLVITFTEAAAREIRERVRTTLWDAGMRDAALCVDAAWISTIHGMCARIVRRHALDLGIDPAFSVCPPTVADTLLEAAVDAEVTAARRQASHDATLSKLFDEYSFGQIEQRVSALRTIATSAGGFSALSLPQGGHIAEVMARLLRCCEALAAAPGITPKAADVMAKTLAALSSFEELAPSKRDAEHARLALQSCSLPRRSKAIADLLVDAKLTLDEAQALAALEHAREFAPSLLELTQRTERRYSAAKRERSLLDYEDLVSCALHVVEGPTSAASGYAAQFKLVMVDEFQDTDDRQLRLISRLSGKGALRLVTVGDAQQSIYRFRGADVEVFRSRARELPAAAHVRLSTNYRSHADILAFVERVCGGGVLRGFMPLKDNPTRVDAYRARDRARVSVELVSGPCTRGGRVMRQQVAVLALQVADRLAAYRDAGHAAGDMALLLGATTKADLYIDALRERGLECVVTGGSTFNSAPEVQVVQALLHTLANPNDTRSGLFPLLASDLFGLDANDFVQLGTRSQELLDAPTKRSIIRGLITMDFFHDAQPSLRLKRASEILNRAFSRLRHAAVADVCLEVIRESGWLSRLESEGAQGAAVAANVLAAVRYIRELTSDLGLGAARAAAEFDRWLKLAKVPPASFAGAAANVVRVMTIHASKGLEFPIVAVAECWNNVSATTGALSGPASDGSSAVLVCPPDSVSTDSIEFGDEPANLAEWHHALRERDLDGGAEERARLLYVGLTRAREALVCALNCPQSKSRGITYKLAAQVVEALFDGKLPPVGETNLSYGGSAPALVRHVQLVNENGSCVASSGATLPACEGKLPNDVLSICRMGAVKDHATNDERSFALFEIEEDASELELTSSRPRNDTFSYTSLAKEATQHEKLVDSVEAAGSQQTRREPKAVLPSKVEREALATGEAYMRDEDRATNLGSAFHALAQSMVECGRVPDEARVAAVARHWHLSSRQHDRLVAALKRWAASEVRREAQSYERLRPELPFFQHVANSSHGNYVEGAIDLLCDNNDATQALVIDYKTGDLGLTLDEIRARHAMQAALYAQVLLDGGYTQVSCAFVCVERDDGSGEPLTVRYHYDRSDPPQKMW